MAQPIDIPRPPSPTPGPPTPGRVPPAGTCPVGWTLGRGRCWKIGAANSWADADAACKAEGATLATIASEADRAFAASLQVAAGLQHMWVNGQEDVSAGATYPTYRTDDGALVNFSGWYAGQPARDPSYDVDAAAGGWHRQCINSYRHADNAFWVDSDCRFGTPPGLCTRPTGGAEPPTTWCEIARPRRTCERDEDVQIDELSRPVNPPGTELI